MALDPDTQYFALGDNNAGAQPADTSSILGIDPTLDLQSAGAQAAPAAGQGLLALFNLIGHLSGKQAPSPDPALPPSAMTAGSADGAAAGSPAPNVLATGGGMGALQSMLSPSVPDGSVGMAPPPGQSPDQGMDGAGGGIAALKAMAGQPSAPNAPLTMPTMPKHNDTALKIIGALSALAGGSGGRLASAYVQQRNANETQAYNQQAQAYQQQQAAGQQVNENQGGFVANLAKLDPATQQQVVSSMTPQVMAANGYTPATLHAQFYGPDGQFIPISPADKPDNPAQVARAQAARVAWMSNQADGGASFRNSFAGSPESQAEYTAQTGLPWTDTFTPLNTAKNVTAANTLAEKIKNDTVTGGAKQSDAQNANFKTFMSLTPALQAATIQSYASDPQAAEAKYGVPYASLKPGMTQADATALLGVNNRETDAQRTATNNVSLSKLNIAARAHIDHENNVVAMRGQDLRNQLGEHQINLRVQMFNQRYGSGQGGAAEKQYQELLKTDMAIQKRMTALSAPQKDAFGDPALSLRDQGRIDADGNRVANPAPTAAYDEYMDLVHADQQLQQQMKSMTQPAIAALNAQLGGTPLTGAGPLPPAPVTVNGNTRLPPGSPVPAPRVPQLPGFAAYTSRGKGVSASPGLIALKAMPGQSAPPPVRMSPAYMNAQHLTPAQLHGLTTPQLLQRLAHIAGKK